MGINYNLAGSVFRHCLATPDAPALACGHTTLSYEEVSQRAVNLAGLLLGRFPRGHLADPPPRVGVLASRSLEACVAVLGACWAGATYVPISPTLPPEHILNMLALSGLAALVTDQEGARLLDAALLSACPPLVITPQSRNLPIADGDARLLLDMESMPAREIREPAFASGSQTACIIFASGTSEVPKGVMIDCEAIGHYTTMMTEQLDILPADRALETCELGCDFSLHYMFSAWQAGASLHILPSSQTMDAVKFAKASGITLWNSVPSLVGILNQVKVLKPGDLDGIRIALFNGEPLHDDVVNAWRSVAPNARIHYLYGPTEATVACLGSTLHPSPALTPGRHVVAIGRPVPGNQAMVLTEHAAAVPPGTPDERGSPANNYRTAI